MYIENKQLKEEIVNSINDGTITEETKNKIYLYSKELNDFSINTQLVENLSEDNGQKMLRLLFNIIYCAKKYKINKEWKLFKGEYVLLKFDYHPTLVAKVKQLKTAKYQHEDKTWIVHISEWREVEQIFHSTNYDIEEKYLSWQNLNATTKLIITEKTCQLFGLNIPMEEIHFATSFEDEGARHTQSYKNGNWDGRIALFDRETRMFPVGLLKTVIDILDSKQIEYILEDRRILPEKKYNFEENVTLRDYQEVVVNKALLFKRGILQLATGAGKTKIACAITSKLGLNTVFFVHTHFLLNQAKSEMEKVLNTKIGQIGGGVVDIQPVTVAMIQTTIQALGREYIPSIDEEENGIEEDTTDITGKEDLIKNMLENVNVIFFDECQFVAAESFYIVANSCGAFYKYGLSATPYRSDKKDPMIIAALGSIITKVSASYLIKRGFLTQPKIHFFNVNKLNSEDKRKYNTVYKEEIIENPERNEKIIKSVKRLIDKNRSVLILVQQITHGELLQQLLLEEGIVTEFVYGLDDIRKREQEVSKLRYKQSLCLIASTIADEGLDIPSLDAVILAGGGKSPSKSLQRVGRSLRKYTEYNQKEDLQKILSQNPQVFYTIFTQDDNMLEYLKTLTYNNFNIITNIEDLNNNRNSDSFIFINLQEPIELNNRISNIVDNCDNVEKGSLILFSTKKQIKEYKKELKLSKKEFIEIETMDEIPYNIDNNCFYAIKIPMSKNDIIYLSKVFKNIYLNNISEKYNYLFEKDTIILNEKNEAFVVDFLDNSRYLINHSLERLRMFRTEDMFMISGIK